MPEGDYVNQGAGGVEDEPPKPKQPEEPKHKPAVDYSAFFEDDDEDDDPFGSLPL